MSTKVFISWSKGLSKEVGEVLNEWIPDVLPDIETWISSEIYKGLVWFGTVSSQLAETSFGILILTPENITSPWIFFEAGALYKGLGKNRICPLLVNLTPDKLLESPLQEFQCTSPEEREDMLKL